MNIIERTFKVYYFKSVRNKTLKKERGGRERSRKRKKRSEEGGRNKKE